jgi:hypothetical protein
VGFFARKLRSGRYLRESAVWHMVGRISSAAFPLSVGG